MELELSSPRLPEKCDAGALDDSLLSRIRAEYCEMPGLSLTVAQASRFWQLDSEECERILRTLVEAGFLYRTGYGQYRKVSTFQLSKDALPEQNRQ